MKRRLQALLSNEISLYAYHLPLDAHPELGNNAQFAARIGLRCDARFGDQELGFCGDAASLPTVQDLAGALHAALGRAPLAIAGDGRGLRRIAWCTGGAQGYFEAAIDAGADAFITGEISEPQAHIARETGVAFLACGHHATERFGAPALGEHIAQRFQVEHRFVEIHNPA
jgi:dinuclear metal center YbgI/SA1388 family protein